MTLKLVYALVVATTKEILSDEDPLTWSYVRVATNIQI